MPQNQGELDATLLIEDKRENLINIQPREQLGLREAGHERQTG